MGVNGAQTERQDHVLFCFVQHLSLEVRWVTKYRKGSLKKIFKIKRKEEWINLNMLVASKWKKSRSRKSNPYEAQPPMSLTCDQAFDAAVISDETIKLDGELSPRKVFFFLMIRMQWVCSHSKTEMCVISPVQRRSPSYHFSEVTDENLCFQDKTDHLTVCVNKWQSHPAESSLFLIFHSHESLCGSFLTTATSLCANKQYDFAI